MNIFMCVVVYNRNTSLSSLCSTWCPVPVSVPASTRASRKNKARIGVGSVRTVRSGDFEPTRHARARLRENKAKGFIYIFGKRDDTSPCVHLRDGAHDLRLGRVVCGGFVLAQVHDFVSLEHHRAALLHRVARLLGHERLVVFHRRLDAVLAALLDALARDLGEEQPAHALHHLRVEEKALGAVQVAVQLERFVRAPRRVHE
mmetsp:Transcript_12276/g.52731  ORF Transcript_12276/g.52731 Transcript_12276/m.52731 type:complete len:202 (-) Transcript_12276:351-956(-)